MGEAIGSGRPREMRVDRAVGAAVHELLATEGYGGATIAAVAARAGVGRGVLYRRWGSKAELVFANVVHGLELPEPIDTGTLAGDLAALAHRIAQLTSGEAARAALAGLAAELGSDRHPGLTLEQGLFAAERRYVAMILERARARGELGQGAQPELVRRLLVGPIALAPLFSRAPAVPAGDVARVVAAGLLAAHPPEASP